MFNYGGGYGPGNSAHTVNSINPALSRGVVPPMPVGPQMQAPNVEEFQQWRTQTQQLLPQEGSSNLQSAVPIVSPDLNNPIGNVGAYQIAGTPFNALGGMFTGKTQKAIDQIKEGEYHKTEEPSAGLLDRIGRNTSRTNEMLKLLEQ
jgi:hypothetical protein